jgi:hypothetical protein
MGGAVIPLPQYAFMAWCSVRGSTGTTLPLWQKPIQMHEEGANFSSVVRLVKRTSNDLLHKITEPFCRVNSCRVLET